MKTAFRNNFNKAVFGFVNDDGKTIDGKSPVQAEKSMQMTRLRWQDTVSVIEQWGTDDNPNKLYRKGNRNGYAIVKKYEVREQVEADGTVLVSLFHKPSNRKVLPQLEVFDAIYDSHYNLGHMKMAVTWKDIKRTCYNVTEEQVQSFIDLCPVCNKANPTIPTAKGAQTPIVSGQFRDRFQVDLIDYRTKPMKCIYGMTMKCCLC
jgi:hypothetical protein